MYIMNYIKHLRHRQNLSEQRLANKSGLSRLTIRQLEEGKGNPTLSSLSRATLALDHDLLCLIVPREKHSDSEHSTVATAMKMAADVFDHWPIHLMEMVDAFRNEPDMRLLLLPAPRSTELWIKALVASTTLQLCEEVGMEPPGWARQNFFLPEPWFVTETEALKAFAILESPYAFRKNNIFVQNNFLSRA